MIPKKIHQTYPSKVLPSALEENIRNIQTLNPGWQYRLYDDTDIETYLSQHFPWALKYYRRISPYYGAVKADFFRYFLLYKEGGVYLDIKSTVTVPLDECLGPEDTYVLSHWDNGPGAEFEGFGMLPEIPLSRGEFQQWFIISAPGHPFLRKTIETMLNNFDNYNPYINGVGQYGVHRLTGPIAYTLAILPLLQKSKSRIVDSVNELGLKYTSLEENSAHASLFECHYSQLRSSILKVSFWMRLQSYPAYRLRRWWARWLRYLSTS